MSYFRKFLDNKFEVNDINIDRFRSYYTLSEFTEHIKESIDFYFSLELSNENEEDLEKFDDWKDTFLCLNKTNEKIVEKYKHDPEEDDSISSY